MPKKPPPLTFVRSFEASARHLSFTRAAAELGCTQAAVSLHIRSLEAHLGADLFVRLPRSLKLTEAGAAYLPSLRQALSMIDAATEAVRVGSHRRTVQVSAPMSLSVTWLAERLARFTAAHPDIDLIVQGTLWGETGDPDTDLTIFMRRNAEPPQGAALLLSETLALLCAPALAQRVRSAADIPGLPKVVVSGRQEYWTVFADALGLAPPELGRAIRTNGSAIALELAVQGAGLTVLPLDLARASKSRGLLVEPFDLRPSSPWGYYVQDPAANAPAAVHRVLDWLSD